MKKNHMTGGLILSSPRGLKLPLSYVTGTAAILGKRRSGKSYKGSVLAEELLEASQQIVVLDPTSAWWGLRSSADGRRAGYPITIVGGEHGDLSLDPAAGAELARAVVHERFSAIFDFDGLTLGAQRRFSIDFLETLYREKRGEWAVRRRARPRSRGARSRSTTSLILTRSRRAPRPTTVRSRRPSARC